MVHLCSYIINNKETYLYEVDKFAAWCQANILFLKMIMDWLRRHWSSTPLVSGSISVERVSENFRYLWSTHLWGLDLDSSHPNPAEEIQTVTLPPGITEEIQDLPRDPETFLYWCYRNSSDSVWYSNCTIQDRKRVQRVMCIAWCAWECVSRSLYPRAMNIIKDSTHPNNCLFSLI